MSTKNRKDELDAFWDIDGLMPAKRPAVQRRPGATDAVEIEVPSAKPQPDRSDARLSRSVPARRTPTPEAPATPDAVWEMQGGLVHRVTVYPWKSGYTYYEKFCRDGEYLRRIKGKEAPHVGFFSYMPQYGQMTKQQLAYYLWWRENIRSNGIYLPADYSYILLNMYELINLPDDDPTKVRDALCRLWVAYHKDVPRLDRYFAEWICDFCLLHGLPAPVEQLAAIREDVLAVATFKEFYLDCGQGAGEASAYARALLGFCCQYDYRKSKFAQGESKQLYDRIIPGVLTYLLEQGGAGADILRGKGDVQESTLSRDSYVAALCSHRIKKRIEIRYCSISRSHELRFAVTDMVKYTENRIRAHMGVKSRLSVTTLSDEIKREMDAYLDEHVPRIKSREQEQEEQYEKLYDLPVAPLNLSRSAEIEQESWETTKKLVEAFEDEEHVTPTPEPIAWAEETALAQTLAAASAEEVASLAPQSDLANALAAYLPFIAAVAKEDVGAQRAVARQAGRMPDAMADEINEIAAEVFGDVILEEGADGYVIIEDYREQLSSLFEV